MCRWAHRGRTVRSLILLGTPKFEFPFHDYERGVNVSYGGTHEKDLLKQIEFGSDTVTITTAGKTYNLDISRVADEEIEESKRVLKKMNFDSRFELIIL